jgi:hypothetical protein
MTSFTYDMNAARRHDGLFLVHRPADLRQAPIAVVQRPRASTIFAAIVAELVFLTGEAIENASAAMFNAGAEFLRVGATSAMTAAFLGKRRRGKRSKNDDDERSAAAHHLLIPFAASP